MDYDKLQFSGSVGIVGIIFSSLAWVMVALQQ